MDTGKQKVAIMRAINLLALLMAKQAPIDINSIDLDDPKSFEMDIGRGMFKSDGPEDHQRMMEALAVFKEVQASQPAPIPQATAQPKQQNQHGLTLPQVVDKLILLKKDLSEATRIAYKKTATEFSNYLKHPLVYDIMPGDITRYQEYLSEDHKTGKNDRKANSTRTIDNKIGNIRSIINFAKKQGYTNGENPAANRELLSSKKRKLADRYAIFDTNEIRKLYWSTAMAEARKKNPDYYWVLMLAIHTGCRISEITSLKANQFKVTDAGTNYIQLYDSKTSAGVRPIPIPQQLLDAGLSDFIKGKDKIFKYQDREGKGSGNAVGKKFKRMLEQLELTRDRLVFHSLRKFVNDFLKQKGIRYEVRCQFIGHEVSDINNAVYANNYTIDQIAEMLDPLQADWAQLSGLALLGH